MVPVWQVQQLQGHWHFVERYRQLNAGANPKGALIKALACNSADDLGNPGPDFYLWFWHAPMHAKQ